MRVFAGLWPTPDVRAHLASSLAAVTGVDPEQVPGRADSAAIRWTAAENWHVTLAFYGDLGDGRVEVLAESLSEVAARVRSFDLRLAGAGVFAHRTLWAGVAGDLEGVRALVVGCREAGEAVGARHDDRVRSRPHLTLGRVAPPRGPGERRRGGRNGTPDPGVGEVLVHALAVYRGPQWRVDEVVLTESRPGEGRAGGPLYRPLARWSLGAD